MVSFGDVHYIICEKVENVELTAENIEKLLEYDAYITMNDKKAYICNNKVINYGICDPLPPMSFEEYLSHFYAASDWAIMGEGASDENPEALLQKFNDLNLTFKEVESMNVKQIYKQMNEQDKKAMRELLFDEEADEFFEKYDHKDALVQKYSWSSFMTPDENYYLEDDIWGDAPIFNQSALASVVSTKWVAKYHFAECLKDKGCEQTRKAIEKAIPGANVVIVTPEVLEEVLVLEVKEKIIDELI